MSWFGKVRCPGSTRKHALRTNAYRKSTSEASIQSKDGTWHWADGKIDGSELIVSNKNVSEPIAVRYAYTQHPKGNLLYNKDGQPVGPFSTIGYGPEADAGKK